jgi:uncharacterized membrane protein YvbJ
MDEETIGQRTKKDRRCQCPQCQEWFFSGKARYTHQRNVHGKVRKKPVMIKKKLVPASLLY